MAKILILEDSFSQAESLRIALEDMGYEVAGVVASGAKALKVFREQQPDLAILDIKVFGEMDGIEVGKIIQAERPIPVIYVTAYDQEFARTIPTHPAAFFGKPYSIEDLNRAIELAIYKHVNSRDDGDSASGQYPCRDLTNLFFASDCIWVKPGAGQAFVKLSLNELRWFKADNVYLDIVTASKDKDLKICLPMSRLLECMAGLDGAYRKFVQIHRSYLVNTDRISRFSKELITIDEAEELPVGKTFLPGLLERIKGPQ